jgi:TRAP-type uncharacterized transport system substrate-binding protein
VKPIISALLITSALALAPSFVQAQTPTNATSAAQCGKSKSLCFCAGSPSGNYSMAAKEIGSRLGSVFDETKIINTDGSLANLDGLVNGTCDVGFAQSDVFNLYRIQHPSTMTTLRPFRTIYQEYVQILCPRKTGWTKLTDLAKARAKGTKVKMIVGKEGTGTAETWRSFVGANPDAYDKFERLPDPVNIEAATTVMDSPDTCMLWVSGLNSGDMQAANAQSTNTRGHQPSLSLISIDDEKVYDLKDSDGNPLYDKEAVTAIEPKPGVAAFYQNLIPERSTGFLGMSSEKSVDVATVKAVLMITQAERDRLGASTTTAMIKQIGEALPTIRNKVDPNNKE